MFKKLSSADEIFEGMKKAEINKYAEEETKQDSSLVRAIEELKMAGNAFEDAGLKRQASQVTDLMVSLASKSKPKSKKFTPDEKQVFKFYGFDSLDADERAFNGIEDYFERFSQNNESEELDHAIVAIQHIVNRLKTLGPICNENELNAVNLLINNLNKSKDTLASAKVAPPEDIGLDDDKYLEFLKGRRPTIEKKIKKKKKI